MSDTPVNRGFEPAPADYDAMIDWPRRLTRETPFFRTLFERVGVRRVLDAACGTGRHAGMFHSWGLDVTGADAEPAMLAYCREKWGGRERLAWVLRPFDRPHDPPASMDALVCLGNSLAISPDMGAVERGLAGMLASLRPGGVLIVQVLNAWRLADGDFVFDKWRLLPGPDGPRVLLKGMHRRDDQLHIEMADVQVSGETLAPKFRKSTLLAIHAGELGAVARRCGAAEIELFGDYERNAYDRAASQDIILVARR